MNQPPETVGNGPAPLRRIHDHPVRFLTYEGPVQNKTGRVHIAEHGRFEIIKQTPGLLAVRFDGIHLKGRFLLRQTDEPDGWSLTSE